MQENPRTDNGETEEGQRELASGNSNATADHSDASPCIP